MTDQDLVEPAFLDTNIILRHLLGDHPDHSPRATAFLRRVERNEIRVRTADTVVFETVFVLERTLRHPKSQAREGVLSVLALESVVRPEKDRMHRAFDFYVDRNIPFADAYHAALMADLGLSEIVTFDRDFDRIPGLRRVEP